jgi:hypothetical protein
MDNPKVVWGIVAAAAFVVWLVVDNGAKTAALSKAEDLLSCEYDYAEERDRTRCRNETHHYYDMLEARDDSY